MLTSLDTLSIFCESEKKEDLIQLIRNNLAEASGALKEIQKKLNHGSDFTIVDYEKIQKTLSLQKLTSKFFDDIKEMIAESLAKAESLEDLDRIELDLAIFCREQELEESNKVGENRIDESESMNDNDYISPDVLGEGEHDERFSKIKFDRMLVAVNDASQTIIEDESRADFLIKGSQEFELYFKNAKLKGDVFKAKTLAIIDDKTRADQDLFITSEGIVPIKHSKVDKLRRFDKIEYQGKSLKLGCPDEYANNAVNLGNLYNLLESLKSIRNR